jgi:hypothetical protein
MAQVIIQKYTSVVAGGMDAIIMNTIAFTFISGLACGGLLSGIFASRIKAVRLMWIAIELAAAFLSFYFIRYYNLVHNSSFSWLAGLHVFSNMSSYYFYVFLLNFSTAFILALIMGLNFPMAFESLSRRLPISTSLVAILILFFNTLGAAIGAHFASHLILKYNLGTALQIAGGLFCCSAFTLLFLGQEKAKNFELPLRPANFQSKLPFKHASLLIFISGVVGFSVELFLLRVNSIKFPFDHAVYGTVVAKYLVLWSIGCATASLATLPALHVFRYFTVASSIFSALVLFYFKGFPDLLMLFPAFFTGWLYGQIHRDLRELTPFEAAKLTFWNISGCFLGGILTGYLFPSLLSIVLVFPALGLLLSTLSIKLTPLARLPRYSLIGTAAVLMLSLAMTHGRPAIRFFKQFYDISDPKQRFEVAEDWSGVAVLQGDYFWIGGLIETPYINTPLAGFRPHQLFIPGILKKNDSIAYVGIAFGITNGLLAKMNPQMEVTSFDYFQSLPKFWKRYPELNFGLLSLPNSRVKLQDGRLGMKLTDKKFDLVMEFTNGEGVAGISAIKSEDYFQLVKSKLNDTGALMIVAGSKQVAYTLQRVFKNVYKQGNNPIFFASDRELQELVDEDKMHSFLQSNAEFRQALQTGGILHSNLKGLEALNFQKVPPIIGLSRWVRDIDPIADYSELVSGLKK